VSMHKYNRGWEYIFASIRRPLRWMAVLWLLMHVCLGIIYRRRSIRLIRSQIQACGIDISPHPVGAARVLLSADQDIRSLANSKRNHVGRVWLDRNKIVGNNLHFMAINTELLIGLSSSVDQSDTMRLVLLESKLCDVCLIRYARRICIISLEAAVKRHLAINQVVIRRKRERRLRENSNQIRKVRRVSPVRLSSSASVTRGVSFGEWPARTRRIGPMSTS
jgi:hypothetical protein